MYDTEFFARTINSRAPNYPAHNYLPALLALLLVEFIRRQTRRYTHTQINRQKTHSPLGWFAFACSGNRPAHARALRNRCAASVLRGLFLPIPSLSSFPAGKEWHQYRLRRYWKRSRSQPQHTHSHTLTWCTALSNTLDTLPLSRPPSVVAAALSVPLSQPGLVSVAFLDGRLSLALCLSLEHSQNSHAHYSVPLRCPGENDKRRSSRAAGPFLSRHAAGAARAPNSNARDSSCEFALCSRRPRRRK